MKRNLVLFVLLLTAGVAYGTTFQCNEPATMQGTCCQWTASCDGVNYTIMAGKPCGIQCYTAGTRPGQLLIAGSADCSPTRLCAP
jgi:hypothetical protein